MFWAVTARADTGRWTQAKDWSGPNHFYPVHMSLIPGDGALFHSRLIWWLGANSTALTGFELGWRPGFDSDDSISDSSFINLQIPAPGVDVFCAGNTSLADGRLFVPGGNDPVTGIYGERRARIYTPGAGTASGSWSDPGAMKEYRWYPTATTLRDGRVLVTAGVKHPHHRVFGGRRNGAAPSQPSGDYVYRFAPVDSGAWDPAVLPDADPNNGRPRVREGHTAVEMRGVPNFGVQVYFGGADNAGTALNDTWFLERLNNFTGADYRYAWSKPLLSGAALPKKRSEHTAIVAPDDLNMMVVFGGLDSLGVPLNDVWRLYKDPFGGFTWSQMDTSGTGPSARRGQAAFYDKSILGIGSDTTLVKRMIVYGGTDAGTSPGDQRVWELRFSPGSPNAGTWREIPQATLSGGGPLPAPRFRHALVGDLAVERTVPGTSIKAHAAYLYGGQRTGGALSDSLWVLWLCRDDSVRWQYRATGGTYKPGARARHSLTFDPDQGTGRLYVFGGDSTGSVQAHGLVYAIDPWDTTSGSASWRRWADAGFTTSGQTMVREAEVTHARVAEVFDPVAGTWLTDSASTLLQTTYPLTFLVPGSPSGGGRVIALAQDPDVHSYRLDIPASGSAGGWHALPSGNPGFNPSSAAMYLPGRLMIAGGDSANLAVGITKIFDAADTSSSWVRTGYLAPRLYHNLVLLPNGQVLAVGGSSTNDQTGLPATRPQIWNPDDGTWTDTTSSTRLAAQGLRRAYHSTALLLPDGRVISSSGEYLPDKYYVEIFSPPYLFDSNGNPRTRPPMGNTPLRVSYGKIFTICSDSAARIRSACFLRPGATTHGFDQNQRFVPLTFTKATNPPRLFATAPANADTAPPGPYLLFIVDSLGTPAVAHWVYLTGTAGYDSCDTVHPGPVADLDGCGDYCGGTADLTWTAPADDGSLSASGPRAKEYDLRMYGSSITESNWNSASPFTGEPTPSAVGTTETFHTSLSAAKWYIRMKVLDDAPAGWSALSNELIIDMRYMGDCGCDGLFAGSGGGGGGSSAQRVADQASARQETASRWAENSLLDGTAPGRRESDLFRLTAPAIVDGACQVRLRSTSGHSAALDAVRLMVVDHPADAEVIGTASGVLAGSKVVPLRASAAHDTNLTAVLDGSDIYVAAAGEAVTVQLDAEAGLMAPLVIEAACPRPGADPDSSGLLLQVPDPATGWRTIRHLHPRRVLDALAVDSIPGPTVRLLCLDTHYLRFVGRLSRASESPTIQWGTLASASSAKLGDQRAAIAAVDSLSASFTGPDTLMLGFAGPPPTEGSARDYFLAVDATSLDSRDALLGRAIPVRAAMPTHFALRQNQPNPFASLTTIRFELPVGAMVRLDVFDPQGRRIRTLANRYFPAGYQALVWDHRDDGGHALGPGVYFYRIEAGPFHDRKKAVLLP